MHPHAIGTHMPGYSLTETINRRPDEVFGYLVDFERRYKWVPGLLATEAKTAGALKAGDRWHEQRRLGARSGSADVEVRVCDGPGEGRAPPFRLTLARPARSGRIEQAFELHAEGEQATRVTLHADVVGGGLLGLLTGPMLGRALAREDSDLLLRLKAAVETEGLWP